MEAEQPAPPAKKAKPSPPRTDDADGEDRLSALDDDTLREILARLPLRDAAATTALSGRWPRVFATLPRLRLDSTTFNARASLGIDYCDDNGRWVDSLDCVLAGREAPLVAFEVDVDIDLLEPYGDWFYSFFREVCRGGALRELRVANNHVHERYVLPSPVYACETLTVMDPESTDGPSRRRTEAGRVRKPNAKYQDPNWVP